jgi:hypothetical protein
MSRAAYRFVIGLSVIVLAGRVLLRVFDSKRLDGTGMLVLVAIGVVCVVVTFLPEAIDVFAKWVLGSDDHRSGTKASTPVIRVSPQKEPAAGKTAGAANLGETGTNPAGEDMGTRTNSPVD